MPPRADVYGGPVSADEFDLLNFFAASPSLLDPDVAWAYNDTAYEVAVGSIHLSFAIAPSVKDVRVVLKSGGKLLYELNAVGVEDIKYHNDKGRESLEIKVSSRDSVWLRIKPEISIAHVASNGI